VGVKCGVREFSRAGNSGKVSGGIPPGGAVVVARPGGVSRLRGNR